jgi:hypothetical protein
MTVYVEVMLPRLGQALYGLRVGGHSSTVSSVTSKDPSMRSAQLIVSSCYCFFSGSFIPA